VGLLASGPPVASALVVSLIRRPSSLAPNRTTVLCALAIVAVAVAGLAPVELARRVPLPEGLQHAFAIGLLTLVLCMRKSMSGGAILRTAFSTLAGSVVLEVVQPLAGRSFELHDLLANGCGASAAALLLALVLRLNRWRNLSWRL